MTDQVYTVRTFSKSIVRSSNGKQPSVSDHQAVDVLLDAAVSTSDAIRILLNEGWSASAICGKLTTAKGTPIPPQFVSNVKNRILKRK